MANGFLELSDAALQQWAKHFGSLVSADPVAYGLDDDDAGTFDTVLGRFEEAMQANSASASRVTSMHKSDAKAALLKEARLLVSKVNGCRAVTDADRVALGIPVRVRPGTIAAPQETPVLEIRRVDGNAITLDIGRLTGRGRPYGAIGITLFYAITDGQAAGEAPEWVFAGNHSTRNVELTLPARHAPGTFVLVTACWLSTRLEPGPLSLPKQARLQFTTAPDLRRQAA